MVYYWFFFIIFGKGEYRKWFLIVGGFIKVVNDWFKIGVELEVGFFVFLVKWFWGGLLSRGFKFFYFKDENYVIWKGLKKGMILLDLYN